ncbi:ferric uptake regulation protein [Clostridium homopropionicum DSM 5847]|uniref:Ferric uptake regulation protein n=1 Tax=Clostridium homopropionicum DSM 5847 TaxID=1121318 RepID=A0A0L6ZBH6_9CLOT|nr:Fur family transcriptional regulator [Clostridium homopropionicum]KOA20153.1 ferric uptake regulation protein [Clostridium homopropionicum DSM 5847]SFG61154.1 Fe2+ or Zn2+ uptake regulation protein [Clostridium homopropionicum]
MKKDLMPFKKILEKNGYEFTVQKQKILKIILDSSIHLQAKEIYEKVKEANIGLATVYRALKIFKRLGIVKEININGTSYYEMKIFSGKPLHIHFKCIKCNSIIDIDSRSLNFDYLKLNKKIEEENNLEIYDSNIMFIGLCNKCRGDLKWQDQQNLEE